MSGVIYDSSIYISSLRSGDISLFSRRRNLTETLWLSAVVLEELYVGAGRREIKKLLAKLERDFEKIGRLVVPNQSDWSICGQILASVGAKYGYESARRARMTNDCLIAMSVARNGFTVITKNASDFKQIAEFRPFNWIEI